MNSTYDLKPSFQKKLLPLTSFLALSNVHPNKVTLAGILVSCLGGMAIVLFPEQTWPLLMLPLVLFVRMALNAMDGLLAREYGMVSPAGVILNELGDVLSDVVLYLPLALIPGMNAPAIVILVVLAIIVEMTGVLAVQIGERRNYSGPMGKSDRALVFGILGLVLGVGVAPGIWTDILINAVIVQLVVTILNRIRKALKPMPV
jgi:CDP-diacylglycerol--glycerol-3-phosphate 3-phosphatidyltransferase